MDVEQNAKEFREAFETLHAEIGKVIVGNAEIIDGVLTCLFAGGHCLLEGVPGLGKTMLVRTLSEAVQLSFSRVQFTPDLMPADIIGTNIVVDDDQGRREIQFRPGPLFAHVVLADEINRATPKTQSALLEAMQEHTVTVGRQTRVLEEPFFVLATQNPIELEGTYPLPEAQVDRFFFKLLVQLPKREELVRILDRTTQREPAKIGKVMEAESILKWQGFVRDVAVAPQVTDYAVRVVMGTQPGSDYATGLVNDYVKYGSSPRGAQALILAGKVTALREGRFNVSFKDIRGAALAALRHRVLLNFEADADGILSDAVIADVLSAVAEAEKVA